MDKMLIDFSRDKYCLRSDCYQSWFSIGGGRSVGRFRETDGSSVTTVERPEHIFRGSIRVRVQSLAAATRCA